jgi:hypothetical protein
MTRAAIVVTLCLLSGVLAVPTLADQPPPAKQPGQATGDLKAAKLAAAERVEEAAVEASSAGGQTGGATAKMVMTITQKRTIVNGKTTDFTVTWTCTGTTREEKKICRDTAAEDPDNCSNTSNGAKCVY